MSAISRKWIHLAGITRVAYSPDGSNFFTCGADNLIRVWSGDPANNNDDYLAIIDHHEAPVLSLDCSMESLVTGCEDGTVALFEQGSNNFTGYITRSALGLSIRCVAFSPNGQRVAVASDETIAKIVDVRDINKVQILEGHAKSIRALTWSPNSSFITTSGSDGVIRVWDVTNTTEQEPGCVQILEGIIAEEEPECEMQCQAAWHPTGKYFVIGTKTHEIAVISRETWGREGAFEIEGHNSEITTLNFSPNGRYLCSSSRDGVVLIWDCTTRRVLSRSENQTGLVSSLAWRPASGSNSISYADNQGYVTRWDNVIDPKLAHPNDAPVLGAVVRAIDSTKANSARRSHLELDDDDLDLDIGGNDDHEQAPSDDDNDFIEDDDDDGVYQSRTSRLIDGDHLALPPPLAATGGSGYVVSSSTRGHASSLVKGQECFQPGATPYKDKRRYLAFNMLGVIHVVERETHNIVTVEFHDQSGHPSSHFDDSTRYTIGSLGSHGAAYASASKENGSTVAFRPFEIWGASQTEWTTHLPAGELATVLAVGGNIFESHGDVDEEILNNTTGSGVVIVATDRSFLRFFSGSGTQKYLLNLGEEVVTMSAGKEWLLVVHRSSQYIQPGRQDLNYTMFDLETYEIIQRGGIPLVKNVTLSWVGFDQDQMPFMYDSNNLLSALACSRRPMQARWVPMLDANALARKEDKQEAYWAVGATNKNFVCIFLKGQEKFPFFPTPITQDLPLQIPLLNLAEPVGESEASLLQGSILSAHARDCLPRESVPYGATAHELKAQITAFDIEMDKSILKLILLACKAERQQQALDLAKGLSSSTGLQGAIRIGNLYSLTGFVARVEELQATREGMHRPSWREKEEKQKRDGKYAHLVDDRTIPESSIELGAIDTRESHLANPLAIPFEGNTKRRKTAQNVFSDPVAPYTTTSRPTESLRNSQPETPALGMLSPFETEEEGSHHDVDDDTAGPSRSRLNSVPPIENPVAATASSKARFNPFAKSAQQPTASTGASSNNPFAKKANIQHSTSLKKSGSFFDRVEVSNNSSVESIPLLTGPPVAIKQSTLFGFGPGSSREVIDKKSAKVRKRKSDSSQNVEAEGNPTGDTASRKEAKKLDKFFRKGSMQDTSDVDTMKNTDRDEADAYAESAPGLQYVTRDEESQLNSVEIDAARTGESYEEEGDSTSSNDNSDSMEAVTPSIFADAGSHFKGEIKQKLHSADSLARGGTLAEVPNVLA